ncbi:CapA family protein [Anaeromicropila herbilytica]|uniref:Capsular polysaccharide biosynthesis protein n=1 Tax=Anaeromicropila herbilytica TaxID=2785025 RepID=A0A7R7ID57_9FIRM|nr:CapA family protein [Anaeromicropila herbilytica]BCN31222.1 capsular polysaccharide biosynthesis protein [Anaeromicropila herbilytica]
MKKRNINYNYIAVFCTVIFVLTFAIVGYYIGDWNSKKTVTTMAQVEDKNELGKGISKESKKTPNSTTTTKSIGEQRDAKESNSQYDSNESTATYQDDQNNTVSFLAVGDDLVHIEVYKSGIKKNKVLNYDHLFSKLKNDISKADISVINQETIFGDRSVGYSGYPNFCSPIEIGEAIKKAGFDVVLQATNHTLDKGTKAIDYTLSFWRKQKCITLLGVNQDQNERNTIRIVEKKGIKFALLNYTFSLNGHILPSNQSYRIDMLDEDQMKADITKAKKLADVVIVFPHWGTEYSYHPDEKQKYYTKFFAKEGVDVVIGSHPHVLQPVEWVNGPKNHKMLVYYSLGNYVSYQREAPRMLGGMANMEFIKKNDKVEIKNASITPIVTHYEKANNYNFSVYKLSDYTENLAKVHGVLRLEKESYFSLGEMKKLAKNILGEWYKEK